MKKTQFLNREAASAYLRETYGFSTTRSSLAKMATIGDGPEYRRAGRAVVYEVSVLDKWARSKISEPLRSTADKAVYAA
jgi:hypothetical protein